MKRIVFFLLLSCLCAAQDRDRDKDKDRDQEPKRERPATATSCVMTYFFGEAHKGQPFVQPLGGGLTYRLAPFDAPGNNKDATRFIGWSIEVAYLKQKGEMEREFSWVLTPPYRQWNARQLNTSYGKSVDEVLKADHTVYFPLDILDYAEADKMVTRILWRSSPPEVHEAAEEIPKIPVGAAKLTILDSKVEKDSMEMLRFKVEVTLPKTVQLNPALASKTRTVECPVSPTVPLLKQMVQ